MRIVSRLDIKGPNLIKGIQLEGLRVIGDPNYYAKYFDDGVDELLLVDCVASLYGRNNLVDIIKKLPMKYLYLLLLEVGLDQYLMQKIYL